MDSLAVFLFDCDGTILDSMAMWLTGQQRLLARYGISTTERDFAEFEHLSLEKECDAYHRKWGVEESGQALYRVFHEMIAEGYRNLVAPREGVRAFLGAARDLGVLMGVATSTPADLVEGGLSSHGLEEFFLTVTTTEEAGRSKEYPDVYDLALRRACERAGIPVPRRDEVWVFEDAPFGLESAGKAGYRTVGIFDPHGRHRRERVREMADVFIDEYVELSPERLLDAMR